MRWLLSRKVLLRSIFVVASALCLLAGPPAADAATTLSGKILSSLGHPVKGALVTLAGANRTLQTTSSADGAFQFAAIVDGEYDLVASAPLGFAQAHVAITSMPVTVVLTLAPRTIGRVVTLSSAPSLRSGGSTLISGAQLEQMPGSNNLSNVFVQLPSAARGSNGQIHLNGCHGNINYSLDGVPLPQALNRVIGSEVDPSDVGFLDVVEGAYAAKYGGKFRAVVNIATKAGTGSHGGQIETSAGSRGNMSLDLLQHGALGAHGGITVSLREARIGWALDPPVPNGSHNQGSISNQFVRVTLPSGTTDSFNFDVSRAYQTFQVPPDTANGTPAKTDDSETQSDVFSSLSFHHAVGNTGTLTASAFVKGSTIRDFPDVANDFAAAPGDNCSGAVPNVPSSCLFAAASNRFARDLGLQVAYAHATPNQRHTIETGVLYDATNVQKMYDILLQPDNYLQPGSTQPTQIFDTAPNVVHSIAAFVQDGWQMSAASRIDYGLRYDPFTIASTSFRNGFTQFSPRLKYTYIINNRSSLYAYYGRLFTPFSFENVSPAAAAQINPSSGLSFDLKPARESLYEIGGAFGLGQTAHGSWKIAHKSLVNVLDDAQVGATNIHQDINFGDGRADFQDVLLEVPHGNGTHDYISLTHSRAVNRGCGSQLLSGCPPPPYDWFDADPGQRWGGSLGTQFALAHGDWLSLTAEYGSGLSTGLACDTCKVPPHFTVDGALGHHLGTQTTLIFELRNMFNDRYAIARNSMLQGTHYAQPFNFNVSLRSSY